MQFGEGYANMWSVRRVHHKINTGRFKILYVYAKMCCAHVWHQLKDIYPFAISGGWVACQQWLVHLQLTDTESQ